MKIYGGEASRRVLKVPASRRLHPLTAMIRRSLFDALGARVVRTRVLDLFAGSGSFGFEALSRGAHSVTFVEVDRALCRAIGWNLQELGWSARGMIIQRDVRLAVDALVAEGKEFDLVFCDPPFTRPLEAGVVRTLSLLVAPHGVMLVRHHRKVRLADVGAVARGSVPGASGRSEGDGLVHDRRVQYGDSTVLWYKKAPW